MMAALCGFAALGGHLFPVYLDFKGGKGAATGLGVVFAINWIAGAACAGVFLAVFLASRTVSLGSVTASLALPAAHLLTADRVGWDDPVRRWILGAVFAAFAAVVIARHRNNLRRWRRGEEPKVRFTRG